jgi:hypothetical protein
LTYRISASAVQASAQNFKPTSHKQLVVTHQQFSERLSRHQRAMLERKLRDVNVCTGAGLRPLVYTSFDGDYMSLMHWMCFVAHALGYVPLNPEAALGSFVINTTFDGSKVEIMRDCLGLELACDEFWHFDKPGFTIDDVPEGVLTELILWRERESAGAVRIFPWLVPGASAVLDNDLVRDNIVHTLTQRLVPNAVVDHLLAEIKPDMRADIESRLLGLVRRDGVRPMAFTSQADKDFKHADWARRAAFQAGFVPLNPSTLLNPFVMDLAYGLDAERLSAISRLSILNAADELWLFLKPNLDPLAQAHTLPDDVVLDLYFWLARYPERPVTLISWRDVDVPKYSRARWAITDREHHEEHHKNAS